MRKDVRHLWRWVLFPAIGALAGYLYYRLVGCSTGACPLTSNPYTPVILGALAGLALAR